MPSRRQRNQPSSRVHDIEFATEISTSLLAQVRQLQALLAERDDALKEINLEKSRLELEAEGFSQRLRALDESEQRYKDENWSLETQTHELMSAAKEASDRETRLSNNLNAATLEKNKLQRELDELNQANVKLSDERIAAQKSHDSEVHILRRNLDNGDAERNSLQKKVDELTGQNQELAKAVAANLRQQESEPQQDAKRQNDDDDEDDSTPESSPPPSPNKATPRHGHLEAETIKSSLHHAHRMIQNLKNNIHREKTEKIELKRMLQDARDELEQRRNEPVGPGSANKRQKTKADAFKKPPRPEMLGAGRRRHIEIEEQDWEDETFEPSPTRPAKVKQPAFSPYRHTRIESVNTSDAYQTANETEDAFETANERDTTTESEAFQTGAESFAGESSDELTETESRSGNGTVRGTRNTRLNTAKPGDRSSFMSTASTSADEYDFSEIRTPVQNQPSRYRIKAQPRNRRSRQFEEDPMSPESGNISAGASPASPKPLVQGRSLFAELGELGGSDGEFGTPIRSKSPSGASTPMHNRKPGLQEPFEGAPVAKNITMVDSSMMTDPLPSPEPWKGQTATTQTNPYQVAHMGTSMDIDGDVEMVDCATQSMTIEIPSMTQSETIVMFDVAPEVDSSLSKSLPLPVPSVPLELEASPILSEGTAPVRPVSSLHLDVSTIASESTQPIAPVVKRPESTVSSIKSVDTAPAAPVLPVPVLAESTLDLKSSSISSVDTAPVAPVAAVPIVAEATLDLKASSISSVDTAPVAPVIVARSVSPESNLELAVSSIKSVDTTPVTPLASAQPVLDLKASSISSVDTAPIAAVFAAPSSSVEPTSELEVSSVEFVDTAPIAPVVSPPEALEQAPELAVSFGQPVNTAPVAPVVTTPEPTALNVSSIQSVQTIPFVPLVPIEPSPQFEFSSVYAEGTTPIKSRSIPAVLAIDNSSAHVHGTTQTEQSPKRPTTAVRDTEKTGAEQNQLDSTEADEDIQRNSETARHVPPPVIFSESGAQTILTSFQIDRLLMERSTRQPTPAPTVPKSPTNSPLTTPKARPQPSSQSSQNSANKDGSLMPHPTRRPGSSSSRLSSTIRPPLPNDHKQAIAAATQRLSSDGSPNLMGPPLAPASAYRTNMQSRPRTPNDNANRNGTPMTKFRRPSMTSRRSSISSFASELDDRFNMARGEYGFEPGTDPRMIQAITQTMIGEFLWKYTRKAGRPEMSNTRHRRYFWVHPYTRTLYWSVHDPQTAGRSQLKAKSVAIEAVRVISDDNPYPPGLHRKSLEVITPGRTVRFTASTSQRHETWFNALSYLLLRTTENGPDGQGNNTSPEAVNDYGSAFGRSSRQSGRSVSSRNSRTTRAISRQYLDSHPTMQRPMTPNQLSPTLRSDQVKHGSVSKLGNMLKGSNMRGTFSSRRSRYGSARGSIDGASAASHDSAEDLRRIIEIQDREADRLENVRACCDGKFGLFFSSTPYPNL